MEAITVMAEKEKADYEARLTERMGGKTKITLV